MKKFCMVKKIISALTAGAMLLSLFATVPMASAASDVAVNITIPNTNEANEVMDGLGGSLVIAPPSLYKSVANGEGGFDREYVGNPNNSRIHDHTTTTGDCGISQIKFATGEATCRKCGEPYENETDTYCTREGCDKESRLVDEYFLDGTKMFADIEYDFGSVTKVKNIYISNHPTEVLRTGTFKIYVSETLEELYSEDNMVYERNLAASKEIMLTFPQPVSARYVSMRVYNPFAHSDPVNLKATTSPTRLYMHSYIRLVEFNVFGTEPYKPRFGNAKGESADKLFTDMNSVIKNQSPSSAFYFVDSEPSLLEDMTETIYDYKSEGVFYYEGPNGIKLYRSDDTLIDESGTVYYTIKTLAGFTLYYNQQNQLVSEPKKLTIGSQYPNFTVLTNDSTFNDNEIRGSKLYFVDEQGAVIDDESKLYAQFNYEFDASLDVTSVLLYGSSNSNISPSHIKLSFADEEADLFTDAANYTTQDIYGKGNYIGADFKADARGKFAGIRIICSIDSAYTGLSRGNAYMRLREIAIAGSYTDKAKPYKVYDNLKKGSVENKHLSSIQANMKGKTDSLGYYSASATATYRADPSKWIDGELYSFCGWTDQDGNPIAPTENIFTIEIPMKTEAMSIYANYTTEPTQKFKYTFASKNGDKLYETEVFLGQYISLQQVVAATSAIPSLPGYVVKEELTTIGSAIESLPVWSEDIYTTPATADITIYPIYEAEQTLYPVTYEGDTTYHRFDAKLTLQEEGGYWKVNGLNYKNGGALSTYVVGEMNVEHIAAASDVLIASAIYNGSYQRNGDMTLFALINLPEGGSFVECGMLVAGNTHNGDSLTLATSSAKVIVAKNYSLNNGYAITLKDVGRRRTRYAAAYLVYTLGGTTYTYYSNTIKVEMSN